MSNHIQTTTLGYVALINSVAKLISVGDLDYKLCSLTGTYATKSEENNLVEVFIHEIYAGMLTEEELHVTLLAEAYSYIHGSDRELAIEYAAKRQGLSVDEYICSTSYKLYLFRKEFLKALAATRELDIVEDDDSDDGDIEVEVIDDGIEIYEDDDEEV